MHTATMDNGLRKKPGAMKLPAVQQGGRQTEWFQRKPLGCHGWSAVVAVARFTAGIGGQAGARGMRLGPALAQRRGTLRMEMVLTC